MKKRYRKKYYRKKSTLNILKDKEGALGAGLALGMLAPMMLGTLGKMMKVNING